MSTEAFVYDNIRTPFGRFRGSLADVRPDDLATHVVRTLVERAPQLPQLVADVPAGVAADSLDGRERRGGRTGHGRLARVDEP